MRYQVPVKFFPEKPIDLLEKFIINDDGKPLQGEIEVYRKIYTDCSHSKRDWYVWHDFRLPFHSNTYNPYRKTSAQIDFLVLNSEGILIIEVKGGPISLRDSQFYYGSHYDEKMSQNPFHQAEGYKFTVKDRVLDTGNRYLISHAVVFPHSPKDFKSRLIENNILWTKRTSSKYNESIEDFMLSVHEYNRIKHEKYLRKFPRLTDDDMMDVIKLLNPIVEDINRFYSSDTHEWLKIISLDILMSLQKNDRIMIEGGPGTGKTTIAKAFIDKQLTKKGLYICWNNLLMHHIRHQLKLRGLLESCDVYTLSGFILNLAPDIDYQRLLSCTEKEYFNLFKHILTSLNDNHTLSRYDYLVVDEGQDILDRGIDLLINELTGVEGTGLTTGKSLILYDIDQSYYSEGRELVEISEILLDYYSHFKLNENKRSAQTPTIRALSTEILNDLKFIGDSSTPIKNREGIVIHYFSRLEEIKNYLIKNILSLIRKKESSLKGSDIVILIESALMRDSVGDEPGMQYWLTLKDVEELTGANISETSNKLRYTSILKYKGLEKDNVIIIAQVPDEHNKYELYVGITRAISNVELLFLEK